MTSCSSQIKDASLSANLRNPGRGYLDLTWTIERDLEGKGAPGPGTRADSAVQPEPDQGSPGGEPLLATRAARLPDQLRAGGRAAGKPRLRDQSYRAGYNTQCCGFQMEYLNRNFIGSSIQEFRVLINLKGVGNVVDLHEA